MINIKTCILYTLLMTELIWEESGDAELSSACAVRFFFKFVRASIAGTVTVCRCWCDWLLRLEGVVCCWDGRWGVAVQENSAGGEGGFDHGWRLRDMFWDCYSVRPPWRQGCHHGSPETHAWRSSGVVAEPRHQGIGFLLKSSSEWGTEEGTFSLAECIADLIVSFIFGGLIILEAMMYSLVEKIVSSSFVS